MTATGFADTENSLIRRRWPGPEKARIIETGQMAASQTRRLGKYYWGVR
jgi:hypothetical protein